MYTDTVTIDGDGIPDAVIATVACRIIVVRENTDVPTTAYDAYEPTASQTPKRMGAGEGYIFDAGKGGSYAPGTVVGYLNTVAAPAVVFSKEHRQS